MEYLFTFATKGVNHGLTIEYAHRTCTMHWAHLLDHAMWYHIYTENHTNMT